MTKIHFLTAWTGRPRTSTTVVKFFEISAQDHGGQKLLFIPTLTGGAKSYDICDFNTVFLSQTITYVIMVVIIFHG